MKAKTFENLIRKVVREEIDYSLRREIKSLKEDLRSELKPTIIEQVQENIEVPQATKNSLREKIMGNAPIKKHQNLNYTSNSALNDLLNETAQGDTNTSTGTSPVSLEEDMSTIGGVPVEVAPKSVVDAVNRDYSGLMEAITKKKGK